MLDAPGSFDSIVPFLEGGSLLTKEVAKRVYKVGVHNFLTFCLDSISLYSQASINSSCVYWLLCFSIQFVVNPCPRCSNFRVLVLSFGTHVFDC